MSLLSYATQKASSLTLIEGPFTDLNWASLGADYVLRGLIQSQKYQLVIVVTFDRPKDDIVANTMDVQGDPSAEGKLCVIESLDVLSGGKSFDSVYDKVEKASIGLQRDSKVGVIIYSVSSMLLSKGWGNTKRFLDNLAALFNKSDTTEGRITDDFRKGENWGTVIGTVNESLHSRQQLTMLRGLADTHCRLTPNSGSLSAMVAVEAHIIRRSVTATGSVGRVSEVNELFMFASPAPSKGTGSKRDAGNRVTSDIVAQEWVPMRLVSLPKVGDEHESCERESEDEDVGNLRADSVLHSMLGKAGVPVNSGHGSDSDEAGKSQLSEAKSKSIIQTKQRLVTFSSNDQEFDEDSDPDADLDL